MAQTAYDLSVFENRPERPKPRVRAVKGHKRRYRRLLARLRAAAAAVVLGALMVGYLYSQVAINELTVDIQTAQSQLTSEKSTYNYLSGELDAKTSLKNVDKLAGELGLVKADPSQVTYFSLGGESVIRRPETASQKIGEFLSTGLLTLMNYLDP